MKKTFKRIRIMIGVIIALVALSAYLVLYAPIYEAYKDLTIDNFLLTAGVLTDSANGFISRCEEGAQGLSSRTMIKRKLAAHKAGTISEAELRASCEAAYRDGARVLEHLIGAVRVSDGRALLTFGNTDGIEITGDVPTDKTAMKILFGTKHGSTAKTELAPRDASQGITLLITSPITQEATTLGHDFLLFDLNHLTAPREGGSGPSLSFITKDEATLLINETPRAYRGKNPELIHGDAHGRIGLVRKAGGTNAYTLADTECDILFKGGSAFALKHLTRFLVILVVVLVVSNLFTVTSLRGLLTGLELSRDAYREYATHDPLTGLYTRRFLDLWMDSELPYQKEGYSIAVLDLDRFKEINDTLGHDAGDEALRHVATMIQQTLRAQDVAIRLGGDEFVILLPGVDGDNSWSILARLDQRMRDDPFRDFGLSVSWGIASVAPHEGSSRYAFETALKAADRRMYERKRGYRGQAGSAPAATSSSVNPSL